MLSLHPDTFSCIAITSDSNNLSELIQVTQQMCFVNGIGQSLEGTRVALWVFVGSSLQSHLDYERGPHPVAEKAAPRWNGPRIAYSVPATSYACSYIRLPLDTLCRAS